MPAKPAKNDLLFPKGRQTKSSKTKRHKLYEARRARIRTILDRTAKSRADAVIAGGEAGSEPEDPDSPDDTPVEYTAAMSSLHNDTEDRVVLKVSITTYHKVLYEAMTRRRSPNAVTDELVNEALDRIANEIEMSRAVAALMDQADIETVVTAVPPPPAVKPELCEHGNPVDACRQSATCYERMANKQGQWPRFGGGPPCDVAKGNRCPSPLYWRGRARCGCSRPSRRAA